MVNTLAPIWDIPVEFKCPIIGACLTADEHRKVLKRTRHRTKELKSHQMHSIIMGHLGNENKVSQKVDRYLKYKYRREITRYAGLDSENFMDTWEQCFRAGKPEGIFFEGRLDGIWPMMIWPGSLGTSICCPTPICTM